MTGLCIDGRLYYRRRATASPRCHRGGQHRPRAPAVILWRSRGSASRPERRTAHDDRFVHRFTCVATVGVAAGRLAPGIADRLGSAQTGSSVGLPRPTARDGGIGEDLRSGLAVDIEPLQLLLGKEANQIGRPATRTERLRLRCRSAVARTVDASGRSQRGLGGRSRPKPGATTIC